MAQCQACLKAPRSGHNVSHSQRRTKRTYKPNVQKARVLVDGRYIRVRLCTRCLRSLYHTRT